MWICEIRRDRIILESFITQAAMPIVNGCTIMPCYKLTTLFTITHKTALNLIRSIHECMLYSAHLHQYILHPVSFKVCVCTCVWSEWKAPLLSNFTTLTGASERLGVIYSHALPFSQTDSSPMRPLWVLHHAPALKHGQQQQQHCLFVCPEKFYCFIPSLLQFSFSKAIKILRSMATIWSKPMIIKHICKFCSLALLIIYSIGNILHQQQQTKQLTQCRLGPWMLKRLLLL